MRATSGLRAALGMFTVIPAGRTEVDSRSAARAVLWLPVVGALLAVMSTVPALAVWRGGGHGSALVAAVVIVAMQAMLTRGLHLDGLADLADGLGSRRPPAQALGIMRRSDIGPFGVAALVLVMLLQSASLQAVLAASSMPIALVLVVAVSVTARLAVVWSARRGVQPARPDGFGALVAGGVGRVGLLATTVLAVAVPVAAVVPAGATTAQTVWTGAAMATGLGVAVVVCAHATRRLGGVTGDVFGGLVEITATVVLVILAAEVAWLR